MFFILTSEFFLKILILCFKNLSSFQLQLNLNKTVMSLNSIWFLTFTSFNFWLLCILLIIISIFFSLDLSFFFLLDLSFVSCWDYSSLLNLWRWRTFTRCAFHLQINFNFKFVISMFLQNCFSFSASASYSFSEK